MTKYAELCSALVELKLSKLQSVFIPFIFQEVNLIFASVVLKINYLVRFFLRCILVIFSDEGRNSDHSFLLNGRISAGQIVV